jgi:hypothetical protein
MSAMLMCGVLRAHAADAQKKKIWFHAMLYTIDKDKCQGKSISAKATHITYI